MCVCYLDAVGSHSDSYFSGSVSTASHSVRSGSSGGSDSNYSSDDESSNVVEEDEYEDMQSTGSFSSNFDNDDHEEGKHDGFSNDSGSSLDLVMEEA